MATYICAAGKGTVTRDECLACALTFRQKCGFSYPVIKALLRDDLRTGIHVSDLTGCLRKSYYNQTTGTPEHIHHKLITMVGKGVHQWMEDEDERLRCEFPTSEMGVTGTADALVYNEETDQTYLLDFKTIRKMNTSFLPYDSHKTQVNLYAYMLGVSGVSVNELYINYIDVNGPTKCSKCNRMVVAGKDGPECPGCGAHRVSWHTGAAMVKVDKMPDAEIHEILTERRAELSASVDLGAPPIQEPSVMCKFCKFFSVCQPVFETMETEL